MLKIRKPDPRRGNAPPDRDEAIAIAIAALAHIAEEPERVERFAALTGIDPGGMREAARTPGFLPAILDYLAGHEPDLLEFAAARHIRPERVAAAREILSGTPESP